MIVLDASLVAKWFLPDEMSPKADSVLDIVEREGAIVPALFRSEMQNIFLTALRSSRIDVDDADVAFEDLNALPITVHELGARLFLGPTSRLAQQYDLTAYDAEYLALALDHQAALYTGDEALSHAAQAAGLVAHFVE